MARSGRWAAKLAVGGVAAGALPITLAAPASAAYDVNDHHEVSITFVRNGQTVTCRVLGSTSSNYRDDHSQRITPLTIVNNDPGCLDAVYQASFSGTYETAPDSGVLVHFEAHGAAANGSTPGEFGVLKDYDVQGPTGHINVTHVMSFRCDNPPAGATLCSVTTSTNPK
jgi:hypothetical protein